MVCDRCFVDCELVTKLFNAATRCPRGQLQDLIMGLVARLVLSNDAFVQQLAQACTTNKVRYMSCLFVIRLSSMH